MKKTLLAAIAIAFLGTTTLAPTPASAVFPLLPFVLKKDPNFKAVNPYDKKVVKKKASKKKVAKKSMTKSKKKT